MARLAFAVVGVKGVGREHCRAISHTNSARLAAVMDVDEAALRRAADEFGVTPHADYDALLADRGVDVIDICTPHPLHAEQAIRALRAGRKVLVEKPMAVTPAEADRVVRACERTGEPVGVVFQHRTRAVNRRFRELVGDAGELYRVAMTASALRTQAYYDADEWRGTWRGEGGGVLLNQAPHWLDLFQWFFGMPTAVSAWTRTRAHAISVEDQAFALLEFPSGTVGTLLTNTTDLPGGVTVEAYGTRRAVRLRDGKLEQAEIEPPLDEFLATSNEAWGRPRAEWAPVEVAEAGGSHAEVIEEFARALLAGNPPPVDAREGRKQVELASAFHLSSALGRTVRLPVRRRACEEFLRRMRRAEARAKRRRERAEGAGEKGTPAQG